MSKPPKEKRLRLRARNDVDEGLAKMNPQAMKYLEITDKVEIVVAGKKRFIFRVLAWDKIPLNEVWLNAQEMRRYGLADRTIATVRKPIRRKLVM